MTRGAHCLAVLVKSDVPALVSFGENAGVSQPNVHAMLLDQGCCS